ncbi:MAG: AlpA family phage regulatory protein [Burkholderiales bacterium]|nr:AlpA family phage regulatory protein [Burkholderiales bacterium]
MATTDSFLRLPDVLNIIPVSRATWYEGVKSGRFPKQVKLGPRVAAWRRSDIERLVASFGANHGAIAD